MSLDNHADEYDAKRRAPRVGIELPVRCKRGAIRSTVMLKDLNPYGARIEGLEKLRVDEPIYLMLPGLQPKLAFVVWSRDRVSGLEFEHRLHDEVFETLVSEFAIRHYRDGHVPKLAPIRHAA
ncbi:hypothetical protein [Novosphingobium taihuense]|uniref:PilZ domain-containing protein n=1 Tax=Novosphingobium taihuense TaxID=260085 RepID=A0A7W7ADV7_9SPHN|nr:hypothetical protein [Novosphingobium taihuense]MBB4615096.1 hypothetical protein [Novosphingobium taihuense]TWH84132.1 hypothetical protein IQ25_02553 [Novosphingobium taihuense]